MILDYEDSKLADSVADVDITYEKNLVTCDSPQLGNILTTILQFCVGLKA